MKKATFLATLLLTLPAAAGLAQIWAPGILIDGSMDDWDGQVPAAVTDISGDADAGTRDIIAVYLANDQNNLYVRLQSANSLAYHGNDFTGIDGDSLASTGFNAFTGTVGSDTFVTGSSVAGASQTQFGGGAASPNNVPYANSAAGYDIEFAIALSTTLTSPPADIASSFPGGLGSIIAFVYGDLSAASYDWVEGTYTLASGSSATPTTTIDDFSLFDSASNAAFRTVEHNSAGFSYALDTTTGPAGGADVALAAAHTTTATDWNLSVIGHRFASPVDITGHTDITLDVLGDAAITNQNIWLGLLDTGGTYYAVGGAFPNSTSWTTLFFGPTSGWSQQVAGDDGVLDLTNIIEWRMGIQESTPSAGGTFNVAYDNLLAPNNASVSDWAILE